MGGNLAIKLGSDSRDLVTVDLDHDDQIELFLEANPAFRHALRTRASKGGQFWFYAPRPTMVLAGPKKCGTDNLETTGPFYR
jgi:hypothetical protein